MSYKAPTLETAKMRQLVRDISRAGKEAHNNDKVPSESRGDVADPSSRDGRSEDDRDQVQTGLDDSFHSL